MTELAFVNIHGQRVDTDKRVKLEKRVSNAPSEFHKGWAVEGIPPGAIAEAQEEHTRKRNAAINAGAARIPDDWDIDTWLRKDAKFKRVRTKAYEISSAAEQCKELAEKAGWTHVRIRALTKGGS